VPYGNPGTLVFDADVIATTGVFAGLRGLGTVTLVIAGDVQQIIVSLDRETT
jgi:hypothetical protein